jgi:hypothetical protein
MRQILRALNWVEFPYLYHCKLQPTPCERNIVAPIPTVEQFQRSQRTHLNTESENEHRVYDSVPFSLRRAGKSLQY